MILRFLTSKRRCLAIVLVSIFFFITGMSFDVYSDEEISENELYAKSAVLMDGKTGRVLYEKNGYELMPMASTTKIMTCIIALENAAMDTVIETSEYAASMPAVHLNMNVGDKFVLEDLLYSLMLESHNDTAVAIAEGVSGSVEAFLELMNQKAKELGCVNTFFLTPNGLDKSIVNEEGIQVEHHTTAAELCRIMMYCINESPKSEEFVKITQTKEYNFSDVAGKRSFSCTNHNSFLSMMEGALSGKTGFTAEAGYCYVGALRKDGKDLIVALLACGWPNNKSYKWTDTKKLMNYGLNNYTNKRINAPNKTVSIKVENGVYDPIIENDSYVNAAVCDEYIDVLLSENDAVNVVFELEKNPKAPVKKGSEMGVVKYYVNEKLVYSSQLIAETSIEHKSVRWAIEKLLEIIIGK